MHSEARSSRGHSRIDTLEKRPYSLLVVRPSHILRQIRGRSSLFSRLLRWICTSVQCFVARTLDMGPRNWGRWNRSLKVRVHVDIKPSANNFDNSSTLSPLYMAEISPPEVRGSLMALEQLAIVLGVVLGFWTGFFTRHSLSYNSLKLTWPSNVNLSAQFLEERPGESLWQSKSFREFYSPLELSSCHPLLG